MTGFLKLILLPSHHNKRFNYCEVCSLVSERLRLRLYNAFVRPVLLYKAGTWGQTGSETNKLNAFHRKQLRLLIGIKWPQRISN